MFEFQEIQAFSGLQQWQYTPHCKPALIVANHSGAKTQKYKSAKR